MEKKKKNIVRPHNRKKRKEKPSMWTTTWEPLGSESFDSWLIDSLPGVLPTRLCEITLWTFAPCDVVLMKLDY